MTTSHSKSYLAWLQTKKWCELNPGQLAAIVTPKGTFTIQFKVAEEPKGIEGYIVKEYELQ